MPAWSCGITNLVDRATVQASELSATELEAGARLLERKAARWRPRFVAILGVGAYRKAFRRPKAGLGRQDEALAGSTLWVLPSPSGLNAYYQMTELVLRLVELRAAVLAKGKGTTG